MTALAVDSDLRRLLDGAPPEWASLWGQDKYGIYAGFVLGDVAQRLRWIPPGRFRMGSPDSEKGRLGDEGPRHEVMLASGFWLFDTPCTQALWQAAMGSNPSRFAGPRRPVEGVSFEDAQAFVERVNARVAGLNLGLPSEAQWEYACRAGSETSTWAGDLDPDDPADVARLGEIAWHDGNSGGGTRDVGGRRPNGWGLHDMLGNVWEWCADRWHANYEGAPSDGRAWLEADAGAAAGGRVVRGGSWFLGARFVRAAFRDHDGPAVRVGGLGFRCARVQAGAQRSGGAAPRSTGSG